MKKNLCTLLYCSFETQITTCCLRRPLVQLKKPNCVPMGPQALLGEILPSFCIFSLLHHLLNNCNVILPLAFVAKYLDLFWTGFYSPSLKMTFRYQVSALETFKIPFWDFQIQSCFIGQKAQMLMVNYECRGPKPALASSVHVSNLPVPLNNQLLRLWIKIFSNPFYIRFPKDFYHHPKPKRHFINHYSCCTYHSNIQLLLLMWCLLSVP